MRENSLKAIVERFGLRETQVKVFFHYLPTFYHLHLHFVHASQIEKVGAFCGKGVFVDDVIDHLEMDPEYYAKKTMILQLGESHALFKLIEAKGLIQKSI